MTRLVETRGAYPNAEVQPRRPRYLWLAVVPDILAVATALLLALAVTWVSGAVYPLLQQHGEKFATHAVMAAGVSEGQAITIAEQLQSQLPGLQVHVIGEAEARGLLALQEPWVRNLPEMELSRLPLMIELRHPRLLDEPSLQQEIEESLSMAAEVDFHIFNDTGFENMREFSREVQWYAGWLRSLMLGGVLILLFFYAVRLGVAASNAPLVGLVGRVVIAWTLGTALALFAMTLLRESAEGHYQLPGLTFPHQMLMAGWCIALLLAGTLLPRVTRRRA